MPRYQLPLSSKSTQNRTADGESPTKLEGRSKVEVLGTEGLRIGIVRAHSGALNEAVFLFDACCPYQACGGP